MFSFISLGEISPIDIFLTNYMSNKISKFCHIYKKNDKTLIYHSLKMLIEDISGAIYNETIRTLDNIDEIKRSHLLNNGFIIDSDDTDNDILKSCRKEIKEPYISTVYFFLTKKEREEYYEQAYTCGPVGPFAGTLYVFLLRDTPTGYGSF